MPKTRGTPTKGPATSRSRGSSQRTRRKTGPKAASEGASSVEATPNAAGAQNRSLPGPIGIERPARVTSGADDATSTPAEQISNDPAQQDSGPASEATVTPDDSALAPPTPPVSPDAEATDKDETTDKDNDDTLDTSGVPIVTASGRERMTPNGPNAAGETDAPTSKDTPPDLHGSAVPGAQTTQNDAKQGSGGGFWAGLIGGAIAALILAFLIPVMLPQLYSDSTAVDAALEEQRGQIEGKADADAVTALEERIAANSGGLEETNSTLEDLTTQVADLTDRLDEIERTAVTENESEAVAAALSAYQDEVATLRAEVAEQVERMQQILSEADAAQSTAADRAELAARRNALADIRAAIDTGEPFAEPLAVLQKPPAPLVENAEAGVPTQASLQAALPEAARSAIASAREANPDEGGRFANFMRNQFGTRSITPREGSDPDAVLSRAEAALTSGDLADAVAQVEALPEPALSEMSDWLDAARTRLSALDALRQVDADAPATPAAN